MKNIFTFLLVLFASLTSRSRELELRITVMPMDPYVVHITDNIVWKPTMKVLEGETLIDSQTISKTKFLYHLPANRVCTLSFEHPDYISKQLIFDTRTPEHLTEQYSYIFVVQLYKQSAGMHQYYDKPVARVIYSRRYNDFTEEYLSAILVKKDDQKDIFQPTTVSTKRYKSQQEKAPEPTSELPSNNSEAVSKLAEAIKPKQKGSYQNRDTTYNKRHWKERNCDVTQITKYDKNGTLFFYTKKSYTWGAVYYFRKIGYDGTEDSITKPIFDEESKND